MPTMMRFSLRGSSPHTRGALVGHELGARDRGIIPAYAGSTARQGRGRVTRRDHPRIRGEHQRKMADSMVSAGSSPHTRGAQQSHSQQLRFSGIIPAYAGSTLTTVGDNTRFGDHPRIRGEHIIKRLTLRGDEGSSPHTRGAR